MARSRIPAATAFDEQLAIEARSWIGTPVRWGQSQKGAGTDCKGLLAGALRALGRPEADSLYGLATGYRVDRAVPSAMLLEGMRTLFDRVESIVPGTLLLLKHDGHPAHLAISTFDGRAVHAPNSSKGQVKETPLEVLFHFFPLHSAWRCRDLAE